MLSSFSYATVSENHGQMILWRNGGRRQLFARPLERIIRADFSDVVLQREIFRLAPFRHYG